MTEIQHQQLVFKWSRQPAVRQKYPELKLMYHVPNERKCSVVQGKQLKLAGVKSGVPDIVLPVARGSYHGLYIELKTEKGRISDTQKWWIDELKKQGYFTTACYGYEEAIKCLTEYLQLKN